MTEDTEQDVDRGNDERIRESDVARAPTQCVKKHEVWRDACESQAVKPRRYTGKGALGTPRAPYHPTMPRTTSAVILAAMAAASC
jgi:hypothetical protein